MADYHRLLGVARGEEQADLVIYNGQLLNVLTRAWVRSFKTAKRTLERAGLIGRQEPSKIHPSASAREAKSSLASAPQERVSTRSSVRSLNSSTVAR